MTMNLKTSLGHKLGLSSKAIVAASLLLTLALSACDADPPDARSPVVRPVRVFTVALDDSISTQDFPGSVTAAQQSEMAFEVAGRIVDMLVLEGDAVTKGAVLARLDPRNYQAAKDRAVAQRNAANADFNRYTQAAKSNAVTPQSVDVALRNLEIAEADLRTAQKALDDTELAAPFAGRIARKLVDDFANIQAKQPILILQDELRLEMEVNVAERDWVQIQPGLSRLEIDALARPRVEITALANRQFPATIKSYTTTADPTTRTFSATFAFEVPADFTIRPGMTGKVIVSSAEESFTDQVPLIPASAVIADADNNAYVWIIDAQTDQAIRRIIRIGAMMGDRVRVIEGLVVGDRIAISGVHSLTQGMKVSELISAVQ